MRFFGITVVFLILFASVSWAIKPPFLYKPQRLKIENSPLCEAMIWYPQHQKSKNFPEIRAYHTGDFKVRQSEGLKDTYIQKDIQKSAFADSPFVTVDYALRELKAKNPKETSFDDHVDCWIHALRQAQELTSADKIIFDGQLYYAEVALVTASRLASDTPAFRAEVDKKMTKFYKRQKYVSPRQFLPAWQKLKAMLSQELQAHWGLSDLK